MPQTELSTLLKPGPATTTLTCRSIYPLGTMRPIMVVARNNPSDNEQYNSPMEDLPCFNPDSLKEPPAVSANRRVSHCQHGGRIDP